MKAVLAVFAIVLVLFPASAFASCPDILGPYYIFASTYYVYSANPSNTVIRATAPFLENIS